jgi:hypothetical protein
LDLIFFWISIILHVCFIKKFKLGMFSGTKSHSNTYELIVWSSACIHSAFICSSIRMFPYKKFLIFVLYVQTSSPIFRNLWRQLFYAICYTLYYPVLYHCGRFVKSEGSLTLNANLLISFCIQNHLNAALSPWKISNARHNR